MGDGRPDGAPMSATRSAPRIVVRHSPIHGRGVFANRSLPAGTRLIEYRGERIGRTEADRRYGSPDAAGTTYLFQANPHWFIDGAVGGNSARFINHSCDPNCEAIIWVDLHGDDRCDRVYIETVRAIRAGEEITFDYALVLPHAPTADDRRRWACACGARNCRGSMLAG